MGLLDEGAWVAAEQLFTKALVHHDTYAMAWAGRARAVMEQGRLEEADADLQKAENAHRVSPKLLRASLARLESLRAAEESSP